ncbi:DUF3800 domain-containing protein [Laspinema olomoucense]|uniref:DUF3800 domain-containing protein n=1 Tax=Laspinema olomoucense TaxID=3231600 RepID=UPI0021BAFA5A|nr:MULTISPECIES: DUF3800 domain-containing protein [unclassified Laspinema]MCT7973665.1 hypothetical protein [Laspinema sp. D3d]MCT7996259.1 hypothetical protein [Laspinema sp. D3c]
MQYVSFADESYLDGFKSIAAFSLKSDNLSQINLEFNALLSESNVREFKWQKLKDAKYRFCAEKLIDIVWKLINTDEARVDVIMWDINDSRHKIKHRDDSANYGRMFYHLHKYSLKRRPESSTWKLYPDEGVSVDWDTVNECLSAHGQQRNCISLPLFESYFSGTHYTIADFQEVKSHKEPCCQVADLFAGMSLFSRTNYDVYEKWCDFTSPILSLFPNEKPKMTNAQNERFLVLQYFDEGCKTRNLGVSLKKNRCLQTPNPKNPINFWFYRPQHEMDKAPTKKKVNSDMI